MPDYSKGKIYAIRAPGTDDVYIGSTTKSLAARMANHRAHYKAWIDGRGNWVNSFLILGYEGAYIELVKLVNCCSKEELNREEGAVVRESPACINKQMPGLTHAESIAKWRSLNKERDRENARRWRADNPDKVKAAKARFLEKVLLQE